jgi:signal transduction histidine kinase
MSETIVISTGIRIALCLLSLRIMRRAKTHRAGWLAIAAGYFLLAITRVTQLLAHSTNEPEPLLFGIIGELLLVVSMIFVSRLTNKTASEPSSTQNNAGAHEQNSNEDTDRTSAIAHDFHNTLFALTGYTDLAIRSVEEGSDMHQNLIQIQQAGERATDLVRQILAVTQHPEK